MEKKIEMKKHIGGKLHIVLAFLPSKSEWVTWLYNEEFDGYTNGHYYTDREQAVKDYNLRG